MEKGLRRIEQAVRDADDQRWQQTNPEVAARAQSLVNQLESSVAALRADLDKATSSGNEKKVAEAKAKLEAQEQWLSQARGNLDEFGG
jgi:capsule polysaccharide export protein KpsE/RkpR